MTSTSLINRSGSPAQEDSAAESSGLLPSQDPEATPPPYTEESRQAWNDRLRHWQSCAIILAHLLCLLAALLVVVWVHQLGGLSWKEGHKEVFNWHPLLMILAYCFMTVAALFFRVPRHYRSMGYSRSTVKFVHGSAWTIAAIFASIALIAVFKSHNDSIRGFTANLYSFHSWLGLGVVGLYVLQFLAGFFAFARPLSFVTPLMKAQILSLHAFLGPFLHMAVTATIMLGIQEKEGFVSCGYSVDKADYFPLSHLTLIPPACLVSHGLGIVVFTTALLTSFALYDFRR